MHPVLEEIYATGLVEDATGQRFSPFPVATPREVAQRLVDIVERHDRRSTLEVGMAYGLSTLAICGAHERRGEGSHVAIDPFQRSQWKGIGLLNIERAGLLDRLSFDEEPSYKALPARLRDGLALDFAFIDGSHLFDNAFIDVFYVDKMLGVGGLMAIDDLWMPAVRRVVSFVLRNLDYELVPMAGGSPLRHRVARIGRRYLQAPVSREPLALRWTGGNMGLLRKRSAAKRNWDAHHAF